MSMRDLANQIGRSWFGQSAYRLGSNLGKSVYYASHPSALGQKIGSEIGSSVTNATNAYTENQQNFNADEAQKQRDWEEYMSNTAVQRAMADYQAAGVNPMLAVVGNGGAAASTPAGASASSNSAFAQTYGLLQGTNQIVSSVTKLGSSAMQVFGQLISSLAKLAAA